ncbi:p21-activated protein kinase-interacting protein 1-like [Impatiens glandulifera]|uniref:p21-activated protein kinase-interacting protein 1-like n=1 Tax=Impatiens glandulifera TaxID=253017 RepID=UPI001FB0AAAE|nr:p21-activated protein kinase-interacting protein 1-like [Impatiens glandulifera]
MSLVAGSYERFIWGFKLKTLKKSQELTLTPIFSFPSHLSAIKSVAVSGTVAASGGSDDSVKIYDLAACTEIGSLADHSATVTALSFYTPPSIGFPRNLITASEDGAVCIYDADPFVHLKTIKAHKKGINDLSVHPSGKLALTVGRDACLSMMNLVRGRRSFYCRMGKEASIVRYNFSGDKFFMVTDEKISVHESEDARLSLELDSQKKVLCASPGMGGLLFTGGEDRGIKAWDTSSGKMAYCIEDAHSARVKGIVVLTGGETAAEDDDLPYLIASASSDGVVRVWDVRMTANNEKSTPLAEASTKSRLTCLAGSTLKSLKQTRPKNSDAKNDEDDAMVEDL